MDMPLLHFTGHRLGGLFPLVLGAVVMGAQLPLRWYKTWPKDWPGRVLISLLAFSLRVVHLQARSLWYDEAFAVLYASLTPEGMVYGTVTPVAGAGESVKRM